MTTSTVKFSVVIPTTIDRGLILPHSVASVLKQTVQDFEILIIGDGTYEFTKEVIRDLMKKDSRIRFFDFEKHPRRGEENRHKVLMEEAKGKYISYLCDRDLMLPNHLETLEIYLSNYDFASTLNYSTLEESEVMFNGWKNLDNLEKPLLKLSCVGHRLDFYKKLPFGWRTTPKELRTDMYMWEQFLNQPECRSYFGLEFTIMWFHRGSHPGMSSKQRKVELMRWEKIIADKFLFQMKKEEAFKRVISDSDFRSQSLIIRLKGRKLSDVPNHLLKKIKKVLFRK
ncbi:MAG: glycosyltransferase [Algoriphagus sp.]|uniref:glycosyltransferase family 2 protein n=1 Tax=Algoriphagus sp. TaxID=1872435 RepID=UPI002610D57E|nr:glycosyltransferase [Algoriphagus sp.]MDG1279449.1 glycosyltransferase [Algoriphagus sp.]